MFYDRVQLNVLRLGIVRQCIKIGYRSAQCIRIGYISAVY